MSKFRKKPVVIEAARWQRHSDHAAVEVYGFNRSGASPYGVSICARCNVEMHMKIGMNAVHTHGWINTPEGGDIVCPGDWIITGVAGEHSVCKPEIFAAAYESAE